MLTAGQLITLTIEKPAAGGRMIARADGQVVLVGGAIPGERVNARVERVSKSMAFAETVEVLEASPDRRAAADRACGGMLFAHIAYRRQLEIKRAVIVDAFARIGRLTLPSAIEIAASPEAGYRMRARLHVRGGRIGLFREGTHDLCDPRPTQQLLDATVDALDRFGAVMQSLGIDVVRELEVSENLDASERAVALDAISAIDARALERLAAVDGFTGFVGPGLERGRPRVTDTVNAGGGSISLQRHVLAFFQGNRFLLSDFVRQVVEHVPEGAELLDLYAGVGLFAITAAVARGARVAAVEGDRVAASDLVANALASGAAVTPAHEPVETYLARAKRGSVAALVVDPPRTGMSREALDGAIRLAAARIVYVSCDVATLARDARKIVDAGYSISHADAFDLFPNTPHVETVVVFDRQPLRPASTPRRETPRTRP